MHLKNIQKLCMLFVLAATAAFTMGGCTEGKIVVDGTNAPTLTTGTVIASDVTNDNKQPSRLQSIQDKVSVQHR